MKNLGTQLELDFGILTVEQQDRVDHFKSSSNSDAIRRTKDIKITQELLLSGGFQEGIDFVNNFKCEKVTETRSFGYGDDEFKAEVTFIQALGCCSLITDYFDSQSNKMVIKKCSVSREGDKLKCSTITDQYRAYKPSSLLTKLNNYNEGQKNKFERANKQKIVLNHTIEKYKAMYPNANVTAGTDYNRQRSGYNSFPIVIVSFESGSYIQFCLGYEKDNEYVHRKFDAVANNMSVIEMLNVFKNQK